MWLHRQRGQKFQVVCRWMKRQLQDPIEETLKSLFQDDETRWSAHDACSRSCTTWSRIRKQVTGLCASSGISAFGSAPKCVNWNLALDWWVHLCNYIQPSHLLWRDICHRASSSLLECQLVGVAGEQRWKIVSFQHTCRSPGCLCNKCLSFLPSFLSVFFLSFSGSMSGKSY